MRKTFILLAIAATGLTATIGMATEPEQRFTRDGETYVYTRTMKADGRTVIEGKTASKGGSFRLVIRGNHVSGMTNGVPVSFNVTDAQLAGTLLAAN